MGLTRRRTGGPVQPLSLLNNAPAWLVTGFDEAREVLADTRFSAGRVRPPDVTQMQPEEIAQRRAAAERGEPPHLAFGHGVHQCLGRQPARIEMRVGLTELFARLSNLRLTMPAEEVPLRHEMLIFGVHSLPATWN